MTEDRPVPATTEITYPEFCWLLYLIFIAQEDSNKLDVAREVLFKAEEYEHPGLVNFTFREWIKEWLLREDSF